MFDLTCFSGEGGAVIEFRNQDEYTEFVEFFNAQKNVKKINLSRPSEFIDNRTLCMRIFLGSFSNRYGWYVGPSRASYEREYKVVNLEDIRIGSADLGEITSEEIALETLFFA